MLKILPTLYQKLLSSQTCKYVANCRYFMSESFALQDVWNKRLNSPILSKIKVDEMYSELDNQFNHFASASVLDIDLFSNAIINENNIDEIEDIVYKLRLTPEAVNILPSTHHAFIRNLLQFGDVDNLLRILNDRLNYGIFPDDYCTILMMDTFLKANNYKNASKIAVLQMLQEELANPIIKYMSIYSCLKYLENPIPWNDEVAEEKPEEDDEEEVKVRVKYIRNPYFDDHFDLVNSDHLIGKTLLMIGHEIPDGIGKSCEIVGSCLYNKWDLAQRLIEECIKSHKTELVYKGAIKLIIDHLEKLNGKSSNESKCIDEAEKIKTLLGDLDKLSLTSQNNFLEEVTNKLKQIIKEREVFEMEKQIKTYNEWEVLRAHLLQEQIDKLNKEKLLAEIKAEKEKIKEKEEELFFFENEQKLDLIIEDKYERPPWKPFLGKKKKPRTTTDDYVPPEIYRREN